MVSQRNTGVWLDCNVKMKQRDACITILSSLRPTILAITIAKHVGHDKKNYSVEKMQRGWEATRCKYVYYEMDGQCFLQVAGHIVVLCMKNAKTCSILRMEWVGHLLSQTSCMVHLRYGTVSTWKLYSLNWILILTYRVLIEIADSRFFLLQYFRIFEDFLLNYICNVLSSIACDFADTYSPGIEYTTSVSPTGHIIWYFPV